MFVLEQFEGIYEVLNQQSIRSISFDGFDETIADRIIKMRPMPSHFVVFARSNDIKAIFDRVKELNYMFHAIKVL